MLHPPKPARSIPPPHLLCLAVGVALLCPEAAWADGGYAEFDSSFIRQMPGQPVVDVSRFSRGNPVMPGRYNVDVYVNQQWRGSLDVRFISDAQNTGQALLCSDAALLNKLDLKADVLAALSSALKNEDCLVLNQHLADTQTAFNLSELRLDISIAQALLQQRPRGYIDPQSWSSGVNSAFIAYRLNHYRSEYSDDSQNQWHNTYLGLNTGINLGNWHLRHNGALTQQNGEAWDYQPFNTYVQRDIPAWRSQLTLGDFYTDGYLFDSNALRGIQLGSDDRMLPNSLQGYAPVVRGMANGNAQVSIYQNGHEIYNTMVPPGPFAINDLYALSNGGDLTVTVTEADGSQHSSTVPYASVTQLLRPGIYRYQLAAGRLRNGNTGLYADNVLQASWQYGLNNYFTANSGAILATNYKAALLGGAVNTPIGALGFDATAAQTRLLADNSRHNGQSYRIHYSRLFDATNTNLTLAAYRYSTEGYYRLADAALANDLQLGYQSQSLGRTKNQLQISVNQYLGEKWGSFYLVGSRKDYWQALPKETEWQLGYSNNIKRLNYSISASQNKIDGQERWQRRYMLTLSLPLDAQGRHSLNSQISRSQNNTDTMAGISGSLGAENAFSYGISASHSNNPAQTSWSANGAYSTPIAKLNASYGQSPNSRQFSAGVSGAAVLHGGGLTLANDLGDTFAIIEAKGAQGARVLSANNVRIDGRGYAIVPYISPYRNNTLGIDTQGLPLDVQLDATSSQVVPRANSSALITLNSQPGRAALFAIKLPDGTPPPLGADVWNGDNRNMGFVAQDGRVFATGLPDSGSLKVQWGASAQQQCRFDYRLPPRAENVQLTIIPAVCTKNQTEP